MESSAIPIPCYFYVLIRLKMAKKIYNLV